MCPPKIPIADRMSLRLYEHGLLRECLDQEFEATLLMELYRRNTRIDDAQEKQLRTYILPRVFLELLPSITEQEWHRGCAAMTPARISAVRRLVATFLQEELDAMPMPSGSCSPLPRRSTSGFLGHVEAFFGGGQRCAGSEPCV